MLYDAEVEKAVLYAIIFEEAELNIQEKDFVDIKNKEIGKAILNLRKRKETVRLETKRIHKEERIKGRSRKNNKRSWNNWRYRFLHGKRN